MKVEKQSQAQGRYQPPPEPPCSTDSLLHAKFQFPPSLFGDATQLFCSVDKSGYWVNQNGSRVLNLPICHRPGQTATRGKSIAIVSSGQVVGYNYFILFGYVKRELFII